MKLYIDPGTGSMLFAILIGAIGALRFLFKSWLVRLRSGQRSDKNAVAGEKYPLVIYSDDKRYWNIFEPVCRELNECGVDVQYLTSSDDDPALSSAYEHVHGQFIGKGNKPFAKLNFISANILLATTPGLDVYQWKRSKFVDCYIHMLHMPREIVGYRMFGTDYFDTILLSGDFQEEYVRYLENLRGLPAKEIYRIGIPYMDEMAKRLAEDPIVPDPEKPRTVLLAPSWGPSAILTRYGGKIIDVLLKTGYHIIVRPHPQTFSSEAQMVSELMEKYPNSDQLEWNRDNDNFEVLKRSDIMISDFSGVIFDFTMIYNKPIIYAETDYKCDPYDAWWLEDQPSWTFRVLPRIGEKLTPDNMPQLKQLIDTCLSDRKYSSGINEVRDEAWEYRGEGAKRTADFLVNKLRQLQSDEKESSRK